MAYKLTINITKNILKESMYCSNIGSSNENLIGQNCAVGRAIFDIFGNRCWVGSHRIYYQTMGLKFCEEGHLIHEDEIYIELPYIAQSFIAAFDSAEPEKRLLMGEMSFEIELPDAIINDLNIDELKEVLKDNKVLELIEI